VSRDEIDGQVRPAVHGKFRQPPQIGVETQEQVEVFRCQTERGRDYLRPGLPMPVAIGEEELPRIIERITHFQECEGSVLSQLRELRVVSELNRREFERAKSGLDEVEAGVARAGMPLLPRRQAH
jgi:hypothetical protein